MTRRHLPALLSFDYFDDVRRGRCANEILRTDWKSRPKQTRRDEPLLVVFIHSRGAA